MITRVPGLSRDPTITKDKTMIKQAIENLDVTLEELEDNLYEWYQFIAMTGNVEEEWQEFRARSHYYNRLIEEREVLIKYLDGPSAAEVIDEVMSL
tara:strand:- start:127 stop:414 length:288 start_codon:yes stop_codon:yes gene_type:complete